MGVFITTQFQGIVGVSLAAVVLMRRQGNPFAAEGGGEGIRHTGNGIREKAKGLRHTANGRRQEAGEWQEAGDRGQGAEGIRHAAYGRRQEAGEGQGAEHSTGREGKQLSADGGTVRTMPIRMPKRIASWMPRRVRAAVTAQQLAAQADGIRHEADGGEGEGGGQETEVSSQGAEVGGQRKPQNRPRQVAVPYQNYRRYRG